MEWSAQFREIEDTRVHMILKTRINSIEIKESRPKYFYHRLRLIHEFEWSAVDAESQNVVFRQLLDSNCGMDSN